MSKLQMPRERRVTYIKSHHEYKDGKNIRITIFNQDKSYIRVLDCSEEAITMKNGGIESLLFSLEPNFVNRKLQHKITK